MPELPEVETIVRDLEKRKLVGRAIVNVAISWPRIISELSPVQFKKKLVGQKVIRITRRAKYIVISLSGNWTLFIHLRMTGKLNFCKPTDPKSKHEHVVLSLCDGRELRFHDTRKFGRWHLTQDPQKTIEKLGPEPLGDDFKEDVFCGSLKKKKRQLKPLLLDQSFIAGLGNIYVDEALWDAGLHPEKLSNRLKKKQITKLHQSIIKVLRRGVANLGTSLGSTDTNFYSVGNRRGRNQDKLKVFRRQGQKCPRCSALIVRILVGQRSSHICRTCQRI